VTAELSAVLAFITLLTGTATITIIFYFFIRNRNRLALEYSILILGTELHTLAELVRQIQLGGESGTITPPTIALLSVVGISLVTYSLPNLAIDIVIHRPLKPVRILIVVYTVTVALILALGYFLNLIALAALSGILEGVAGCIAAFLVLYRRKQIHDLRVRRIVSIASLSSFIALPLVAFQQISWAKSQDFFGASIPFIPQIFLSLVSHLATLTIGIRSIIVGNRRISDKLDSDAVFRFGITQRECDIILQIGGGLSNDEIASRLFISVSTVKNHIYHIFQKTGVHNRVELLNAVLLKPDVVTGDSSL
jgi:DNA-binding CsgD family transcriptional regulator